MISAVIAEGNSSEIHKVASLRHFVTQSLRDAPLRSTRGRGAPVVSAPRRGLFPISPACGASLSELESFATLRRKKTNNNSFRSDLDPHHGMCRNSSIQAMLNILKYGRILI